MRNKKDKSKFVKFCVGAVTILLVGAVCFTFLIFQTNAVFEVAPDSQNRYVDFERMSVSTIIEEADKNSSNQPGMGTGAGTVPGITTPEPTNTISVLGDSISAIAGSTPSNYPNFYPADDVQDKSQMYWDIVCTSGGYTIDTVNAYSGSYITPPDSTPPAVDRVGGLGSSPSMIIVEMGTNDVLNGVSTTDFGNAYANLIAEISSKYPSSSVVCVGIRRIGTDVSAYNSAIESAANSNGAKFVTIDSNVTSDVDYMDEVHPKVSGHEKIAKAILGVTGNATSSSSGTSSGGQVTISPIQGDRIDFPNVGENIDFREINTNRTGSLPRASKDTCTWEFVYDFISTTGETRFNRMKSRAATIEPYIVSSNTEDGSALVIELNNERMYVGCWPVNTGNPVGCIAEFTMSDGSKFKMLCIDAKSCNDSTGAPKQCNTSFSHAILRNSDTELSLSAVELWGKEGLSSTSACSEFPDVMSGKNVISAEIVAHTALQF